MKKNYKTISVFIVLSVSFSFPNMKGKFVIPSLSLYIVLTIVHIVQVEEYRIIEKEVPTQPELDVNTVKNGLECGILVVAGLMFVVLLYRMYKRIKR